MAFFPWRTRSISRNSLSLMRAGEPFGGWGPTLAAMKQGRGEFVGVHEFDGGKTVYFLCEVFFNQKSKKPSGVEVLVVTEVDLPFSLRSMTEDLEGIWHMEYFDELWRLLSSLQIRWLDPIETFNYLR